MISFQYFFIGTQYMILDILKKYGLKKIYNKKFNQQIAMDF